MYRYILLISSLLAISLSASPWHQELQAMLHIFNTNPAQGDSLVTIAAHYAHEHNNPLCYLFAKHASTLPIQNKDLKYACLDLLSVSAWHMHDYATGFNALQNALALKPEDSHLLGNLGLYIQQQRNDFKKRPIVQLQPNLGGISGVEQHIVAFNKTMYRHNVYSCLLVSKKATFTVDAINKNNGQPCITYEYDDYLARLSDIIKLDPRIIICNSIEQVRHIATLRTYLPDVKIIYINHNSLWKYSEQDLALLSSIQAIATVHHGETAVLNAYKKKGLLTTAIIQTIPPIVNDEYFTNFKPSRSRNNYFKERFNLTIADNEPVICTIANFFWFKNYSLLIDALALVKNQYKRHFRAILAGHGPELIENKEKAEQLGIGDCVHFVGLTLDTPELLHFADMHVLPSYDESFGLAHVEAALMKKPFVGAKTTGIEPYVLDGINGLLFNNRDSQSLAEKITFLLDNPKSRIAMGEHAQSTALLELTSDAIFKKWQKLFNAIE